MNQQLGTSSPYGMHASMEHAWTGNPHQFGDGGIAMPSIDVVLDMELCNRC